MILNFICFLILPEFIMYQISMHRMTLLIHCLNKLLNQVLQLANQIHHYFREFSLLLLSIALYRLSDLRFCFDADYLKFEFLSNQNCLRLTEVYMFSIADLLIRSLIFTPLSPTCFNSGNRYFCS